MVSGCVEVVRGCGQWAPGDQWHLGASAHRDGYDGVTFRCPVCTDSYSCRRVLSACLILIISTCIVKMS